MSSDWIVLEKVGKWAGLEHKQLDDYLLAASRVHSQALEEVGEDYDMHDEYFEFLNKEVLSSPQVSKVISNTEVRNARIRSIENGSVNFSEFLKETHLVEFSLDEIVDFVMLLKLIDDYTNRAEEPIAPLEKLYYLVFIVNHRISQEDDLVRFEDSLGMGDLQRTGYRYSFLKQGDFLFSEGLERDKNRLIAWNLIEESVISMSSCEYPFEISIGEKGDFFFTRYQKKLQQFDSLLLKTWERKQREVLKDFAAEPIQSVRSYLTSVSRVRDTEDGDVVLMGRPMNFTEQQDTSEVESETYA